MTYFEKQQTIENLKSAMKNEDAARFEQTLNGISATTSEKRGLIAEAYTGATSENVNRVRFPTEFFIKSLTGATASNVSTTAQAVQEFLASLKK